MPGARSQLVSVHHYVGERPPPPDSLQQPHLTEDALQRMPVTSIGMQDEQESVQEASQDQERPAAALVPASDPVGLLLPAGLSAIFCRAGPPPPAAALPSATPPALDGRSLKPYPRSLLQIVSDQRGAVAGPGQTPEQREEPEPPALPPRSSEDCAVLPAEGQHNAQPAGQSVARPSAQLSAQPSAQHATKTASQTASQPADAADQPGTRTIPEYAMQKGSDLIPSAIEECIISPVTRVTMLSTQPPPPSSPPGPRTSHALPASQRTSIGVSRLNPSDGSRAGSGVQLDRHIAVWDKPNGVPDAPNAPSSELAMHMNEPSAHRGLTARRVAELNGRQEEAVGQAVETGGRSDASTVTAESGPADGELVPDEDDRLSVVSTESNWSDISGFEEDLWRLRSVLRDPTAPMSATAALESRRPPPAAAAAAASDQQLQLHRLQLQLQHASQERELYRQQLEALQGQLTGGSRRQHFEVQRQKARLEGVLEMTRAELEEAGTERAELRQTVSRQQLELRAAAAGSLRTERDALAAEAGLLRVRARELDAQLAEAAGRLETRAIEADAARDELRRSEAAAAADRTALEGARRELEGRDATVAALKAKVAELVVDAQQQLQAKLRAEGAVQAAAEELEQRERSRDWYRGQLKSSQEARLQQQQQLMTAQQELIAQQHAGERQRGELTLARQAAAGAQARAVREKEALMRHLENIQADMLQREAFFQTVKRSPADPAPAAACVRERDEAVSRARDLELMVSELKQQLERSAEELAAAAATNTQLEAEAGKTRFALASTHEQLSRQSVQCEQMQQRCHEGGQMLDQLRAQAKEAAAARQTLKEEKTRLEVALASANQEKRDVDEAARRLTNELKKVSASFYKLKNDVSSKEKQIEELKASLNSRESELRTSNDKLQEASKLKLQADQMADKMNIFDNMNEQNKQLMVQNHELRYKVQQLTQDRTVLDQGRLKLEEVVRSLQQQVNEAVQKETATKAALEERDSVIRDLEDQGQKSQHELAVVKTYAKGLHREVSRGDGEDSVSSAAPTDGTEAAPSDRDGERVPAPSESDAGPTPARSESDGGPAPARSESDAGPAPAPSAELEQLRRQVSLLSVENRELERRLQAADAAPRLRQEHGALTAQVAALSAELQRAQEADSARCRQLQEQLQLSQTRNKQLQQQLAAAARPEGVPAAPAPAGSPAAPAGQLTDQLAAAQAAYKERHRCYQSNIRVLTRKLREYMRALKTAERELAERRGAAPSEAGLASVEREEADCQLRRQLEMARRDVQRAEQEAEQLRSRAADSQLLQLELEKERGRLEGMAQSYTALQGRAAELEALVSGYEEQRVAARDQTPQQQRRLQEQLQQAEQRLTQEQLESKELRRQLFGERRETSGLRRDVTSLQAGLQTAEDVAAARQTQLTDRQAALEAAQRDLTAAASQLTDLRAACDASQRQAGQLRRQAEQSAANDPVLAQQIKTLSGHLHQKSAELTGLQEQARLVEQRHAAELDGLRGSLTAAGDELQQLKTRLDETREERFALQSQVTELRAALQTSSTQVKALGGEVEQLQEAARLRDSPSSLPRLPAPSPVDEAHISRLLEQSASGAESRPLHHLQACLHSLKQEMTALQTQIHQTDPPVRGALGTASTGDTPSRVDPSPAQQPASPGNGVTSPDHAAAALTSPDHTEATPTLQPVRGAAAAADPAAAPPTSPPGTPAPAAAVTSENSEPASLMNGGWRPPDDGAAAVAAVDRFLETTRLPAAGRETDGSTEGSRRLRSYFASDGAAPPPAAVVAALPSRSEKQTDV